MVLSNREFLIPAFLGVIHKQVLKTNQFLPAQLMLNHIRANNFKSISGKLLMILLGE